MYKAIVSLKTSGKKVNLFIEGYSFEDAFSKLKKNEEISTIYSLITLEAVTQV